MEYNLFKRSNWKIERDGHKDETLAHISFVMLIVVLLALYIIY